MPAAGSQTADVTLVGPHVDDVRVALDALEQLVPVAVENFGLDKLISVTLELTVLEIRSQWLCRLLKPKKTNSNWPAPEARVS